MKEEKTKPTTRQSAVIGGLVLVIVVLIGLVISATFGDSVADGEEPPEETEILDEHSVEEEEEVSEHVSLDDVENLSEISEEEEEKEESPSQQTDNFQTDQSYPYPYSEATIAHRMPSADDVRHFIQVYQSENGYDADIFPALEEEYGDLVLDVLFAGGLKSSLHPRETQQVFDSVADYTALGEAEGLFFGYSPIQSNIVDWTLVNQDNLQTWTTNITVDGGWGMENTHSDDLHGDFFEVDDIVVGGFHVSETSLRNAGVDGLPDFSYKDLSRMQFGERADAPTIIRDGALRQNDLARITYFVTPTRRMNAVELYEKAFALDLDINGYDTEDIPHPFHPDMLEVREFFGDTSIPINEEDNLSLDEHIEEAVTVLPGHVLMVHQYTLGQPLEYMNISLTVNGDSQFLHAGYLFGEGEGDIHLRRILR